MDLPANDLWGPDWNEVRAFWSLDPDVAHLNHGSYGAVPIPIFERQEKIRRAAESNPHDFFLRRLYDGIDAARAIAAEFIGTDLHSFAFTRNTSFAINAALRSIVFEKGDELLLSDHTYQAIYQAALELEHREAVKVVEVPIDIGWSPAEIEEAFLQGVTARTKAAVVDQIASPTGLMFPVSKIVDGLRSKGVITIVDGAHAPGMVDLNVSDLGAHFWVGNFHKWVCSPRGAAGLVVDDEAKSFFRPPVISWRHTDGYPTSVTWQGTDDYSSFMTVPDAIRFMSSLDWDRVRAHNRELASWGSAIVSNAIGQEPVQFHPQTIGPMGLIRLPEGMVFDHESARRFDLEISRQLKCEVRTVVWRDGFIRVSAQVYNCPSEFERLADGLPGVLSGLQ